MAKGLSSGQKDVKGRVIQTILEGKRCALLIPILVLPAQNEGWNTNMMAGALASILDHEVNFRIKVIMLNVR